MPVSQLTLLDLPPQAKRSTVKYCPRLAILPIRYDGHHVEAFDKVNLAHFLSDIVERERRSTNGTLAPSRPGTPDILLGPPHTLSAYGKREDIIHTTFSRTIQGIYTFSRMCSTTGAWSF